MSKVSLIVVNHRDHHHFRGQRQTDLARTLNSNQVMAIRYPFFITG